MGRPRKERIIAMVCSSPPEGRGRWTVRLVAEEAVKRKLVPAIGREAIRILRLHHDLKPWREKMWWCAGMNGSDVPVRGPVGTVTDPVGTALLHCSVGVSIQPPTKASTTRLFSKAPLT